MDTNRLAMLAISDSGFVFDPRTGHSYTVNPTGLAVLTDLKQGRPLAVSLSHLQEAFDAPGNLRADLRAFVESLRNYELISTESPFDEAK